ncbi:sugar phosphate isomerase/epimerase family protein [Sphingosinicella soli]|uniref:Sugar phosphate isomerase/epimerase n=1 Tax=Sphingosinicella soli TaxID=333708 RepID=A0A7W7B1Q7_9SPHN|nr:TIM barrel protein [Sphingosinicella soli]MBB4632396.1 sugar phosphate isomerase/epimerase [Sphingosinicella soli]
MTAHALSLHHLTVLDTSPLELVALAGDTGFAHVTLFTLVPKQARTLFPCVMPGDVAALKEALAAACVSVCNLEVFSLDQDGNLQRFEQGLKTGAALGAPRATVHLYNYDDIGAAARRLREFNAMAADYGIVPGLEFNGFSDVKDIATACAIVREAGCGSVVLDVLHLMRNGAEVSAVAPNADLITYVQVSDGPLEIPEGAAWREAIGERLLPGKGEFPLGDILAPIAPQAIMEAEIPQGAARKAGVSGAERARRAMAALRETLPA